MSWLLAFLGFAVLIILHELGHFFAAKKVGMRVERFSLFFPPLLARKKRGETEYAIGAIPLGGYVKITGMNPAEEIPEEHAHRAYFRQPVWKRIVVIAAGPAVNIVLAFLILWVLTMNVNYKDSTLVSDIRKDSPAAEVLRPDDRLLAVDGIRGDQQRLREQIGSHSRAGRPTEGCAAQTPARVTFVRDGREQTISVRPLYDEDAKRMLLGFAFKRVNDPLGPVGAADESLALMWRFTSGTVSTLAQLFKPEKREQLSGVVGSYETTRQAVNISFAQTVYILAVISLSLGIINLFPFLPLDGGHIFWAVAEKLRGRAIPFATMERAGFVGFALVLMLFVIGLTNDIDRLRGDGFDLR